ncbi:MAG TPA: preprotein translocase subunit YajC [Thermoanaerobaculia bacterium]|nr:preprotein translocase subunit YajC [Thermoanaerobaculia bacterium]
MNVVAAAQAPGGLGALIFQFLPILAIIAIFYFLVIAPANKQRRTTQEMLSNLKKGDRVITTGGIFGTIQGFDNDSVILKIADNVKIRILRSAVANLVSETTPSD